MRVLQISHNHHVRGGSDAVFFKTSELLTAAGHEVVPFCMDSPENSPSPWSAYFPRGADTGNPRLRDMPRYFYNAEARKKLAALLDAVGPVDVAHLHIYHGKQTPAILPLLRSRGIPVVQSLHEYKLACPSYTMERNGQPCDACVGNTSLNAVRFRCKDGSLLKSAVMAAEFVTSRLMGDVRLVDRFLCVSAFQAEVMARAGLPCEKLHTLHNFADVPPKAPQSEAADYLLYFGRIETLKGLPTLIHAVARGGQRLHIAGTGNWVPQMQRMIEGVANIHYLGFQSGQALKAQISNAKAVVVPSEWYENCPMSILEAKAMGVPVVGARIGGIPELVRDGVDGHLFTAGDVDDLDRALRENAAQDRAAMSRLARADVLQRFSADRHLAALLGHYRAVIPSLATTRLGVA